MLLNQAKLNVDLVVKNINSNSKNKLRLQELGLIDGTKILVKHKSILKNTMLIIFNNSCFVINSNIAKEIEVNYV